MEAEILKWKSPESFTMKSVKFNNLVNIKNALSGGRILADSSYIKDEDSEPNPMLGFAVAVDKPEVVRLLLLYNADINRKDCLGVSPLMRAAALDRIEIFELFLASGRADLTSKDNQGQDCESVAKRFGSSRVLREIQKHKNLGLAGTQQHSGHNPNTPSQLAGQNEAEDDEYL